MLRICICIYFSLATTQAEIEGYVVGGASVSIKRFPHSAFLTSNCYTEYHEEVYWVCGASLLNQQILLTAAHCMAPCISYGTRMSINVGHEHRTHGIARSVNGYVFHEKYDEESNDCDIGMVKITIPVRFSEVIRRVALMQSPPFSETAFVAGWGDVHERTGEQGFELSEIDQKIWQRKSCLRLLRAMPKGAFCASSPQKKKYASAGDSGAALMVHGYIQIGLVSYKVPAAAVNVIVYTDVGYHYEWIDFNARRLYCS